jgi:alkylation response protein AidB-like acyl-CoA dehydrogenase
MNLLPDAEQTQLLDAAVDFLRKEAPVNGGETPQAFRARMGRPFWSQVAGLGWIGLGLTEEQGGVGYTLAEEALFFREFGRHLLTPTIIGAVLGARLAVEAGKAELAAAIVAGEALVAVAFGEGEARYVLELDGADYVLEVGPAAAALYPAAAFEASAVACLDDRLAMARGVASGAPAAELKGAAAAALHDRGAVLCAAMLAGMAEACRDVSVDYAKTRRQFGVSIGSFQAVKHKCADMAVRCEAASAMAFYAALAVRDGLASAAFDASAAKACAAEAAIDNASIAVQVHGGMGFTEQMTPQLYVKRARVIDQLFGDKRARLAKLLGEPEAA